MKIIFLIFVIEGVAVLAEKEINPKDKNVGSMSSDFDLILQLISTLEEQILHLGTKVEKQFHETKEKVNDQKSQIEDLWKSKLETIELSLKLDQQKQYKKKAIKTKKKGDTDKCFAKEKHDFRTEINNSVESALECMNDITEEAINIIKEGRNTFTNAFDQTLDEIRKLNECVKSCMENRENGENCKCIDGGRSELHSKFYNLWAKASVFLIRSVDAVENHKAKLDSCSDKFFSHLKKIIPRYIDLLRQCKDALILRNQRQ